MRLQEGRAPLAGQWDLRPLGALDHQQLPPDPCFQRDQWHRDFLGALASQSNQSDQLDQLVLVYLVDLADLSDLQERLQRTSRRFFGRTASHRSEPR